MKSKITDAASGNTQYGYDSQNRLTSVTDPGGLTTIYSYNGFGDLLQTSSPDTGTTTYTVDAAGNRLSQTDARGKVATYTYDALYRRTSATYADSSLNILYIHDQTATDNKGLGRLTGILDAGGSTSYRYDARGLIIREI